MFEVFYWYSETDNKVLFTGTLEECVEFKTTQIHETDWAFIEIREKGLVI